MADLYFTENDATSRGWQAVASTACTWGLYPWRIDYAARDEHDRHVERPVEPAWWHNGARAIPLHLPAGRDLAERVIAHLSNRSTGEVRHALGSRYAAGMPVEEDLRAELVRWGGR